MNNDNIVFSHEQAAPVAVTVNPLRRPADVSLDIPGSKSLANRALLLAGFADGVSNLRAIPDSDDVQAALSVLAGLGIDAAPGAPGEYRIEGFGCDPPVRRSDLDIRSSGTVGRFLPGLLAACPAGEWRLLSTPQLARRPLDPLVAALRELGADLRQPEAPNSFPLVVRGGGIEGGTVEVSAVESSQFASGLLLAAPLSDLPATVIVHDLDPNETYLDMTVDLMSRFGVRCRRGEPGNTRVFHFDMPGRYRPANLAIEADYNSALYFLALPLLAGGKATVRNLDDKSGQPGCRFLRELERLGARVKAGVGGVSVAADAGLLRGGFDVDMRAMSEMALTLGVLAVFADAPVTMTNLAHIRGHETDRLKALAESLAGAGVDCDEGPDWIRVHPRPRRDLPFFSVDSRGDHRLVMSFALLGLGGNGVEIRNPAAVAKTFPDFFARLAECGVDIRRD